MPKLELQKLSLDFPLDRGRGLRIGSLLRLLSDGAREVQSGYKHALREVDLKIGDGESVGILGRNGSGKTTLLRVLAGILPPAAGSLYREGSSVCLINSRVGIQQELSGLENIRLRARLVGLDSAGERRLIEDVTDFSELAEDLTLPVRTYSAGMVARLAFGMATSVRADILLMDEWLGVADLEFQEKARRRLELFIGDARIIVLASHNLDLIQKICRRAIVMDQGRISFDGEVKEAIQKYRTARRD